MSTEVKRTEDQTEDLGKVIFKIFPKWPFIGITVLIMVLGAFLKNRYTVPVYAIDASVLVKDTKDPTDAASEFLYGDEYFGVSTSIVNESILIKSFSQLKEALQDLNAEVSYFREGNVLTSELYGNSPIKVDIDTTSSHIPFDVFFRCKLHGDEGFELSVRDNDELTKKFEDRTFQFGELIKVSGFKFVITKNVANGFSDVLFKCNDLTKLASNYRNRIVIAPFEKESSILKISIQGTNPDKEIDFLNTVVTNYISRGLDEKNLNATKTIEFIDVQLAKITDSLGLIENQLEVFKKSNSGIDLTGERQVLLERILELDQEKARLDIKDKYLDYLAEYLTNSETSEGLVVPSSLGIVDPTLSQLIDQLIQNQIELQLIENEINTENPVIQAKQDRITQVRKNILENLNNLKKANKISTGEIENRLSDLNQKLQSLPGVERQFVDIQRTYNLSETLYLFLMEKKAEAAIARSSNTPDLKLVDASMVVGSPIKPKPMRNYMVAVILGFLIPVIVILLLDFFDHKVRGREDILKYSGEIPFLGVVGHSSKNLDLVVEKQSKSAVAESFRSIRSNLKYMVSENGKSNTFLITSSISGEGKTFCALNIAYIFAISGKKTLLMGADMRRPNMYKKIGIDGEIGLSNYLADIVDIDKIIQTSSFQDLHVISAGNIPPNPAELLIGTRMKDLMKYAKENYRYIILDTPPVGLVSDALELTKYSDANVFVVRQNYSLKPSLINISDMYRNKKIEDLAILFNDVDLRKRNYGYGYGYNYGYGYYEDDQSKPSLLQRLIKS